MQAESLQHSQQQGPTDHKQKRVEWQQQEVRGDLRPLPKCQHLSWIYKNHFYVVGGIIEGHKQDDLLTLHKYSLRQKTWNELKASSDNKNIEKLAPKYCALLGKTVIVFGSQNGSQGSGSLWKLDLGVLQWTQLQLKGDKLAIYEGSCFLAYQKFYILYYGGHKGPELSNLFYLYSLEANSWQLCEGNYQLSLKGRTAAALTFMHSKLYLYGGYYFRQEGLQTLNDFYLISVSLPTRTSKASVLARKIHSVMAPGPRAEHWLLPCRNKEIYLLGGKHQERLIPEVWFYNIDSQEWKLAEEVYLQPWDREGFSIVQQESQMWLFGGISLPSQEGTKGAFRDDLLHMKVNPPLLHYENQLMMLLRDEYEQSCKLCYQKRFNFLTPHLSFPKGLIESINQQIEFPFNAFGLLVDNSVLLGATSVNVRIEGSRGSHIIRFDDNGSNAWTEEQFFPVLRQYSSQLNVVLTDCDKKTKKHIQHVNALRQYGNNLKMGCLRLGKAFLLMSAGASQTRVFYCFKDTSKEPVQSEYVYYYYAMDSVSKKLVNPSMAANKQLIDKKLHKYLREFQNGKNVNNSVIVFETLLDEPEANMQIQHHDLLLGPSQQLQVLKEQGHHIFDCIDISLKAYLSALYLNYSELEIHLTVGYVNSQVPPQQFVDKVDKIVKTGDLIYLEEVIDNDFKHAEFYFQRPQQKAYLDLFSNGVLLYCRNRLICRFRPKLGDIISGLIQSTQKDINYLPLLGYALLPQNIPVNLFKTNFTFDALIEKMEARLRLVEESFKKKGNAIATTHAHADSRRRRQKAQVKAVLPVKRLPWNLRRHNQEQGLQKQEIFEMKEGPVRGLKQGKEEQDWEQMSSQPRGTKRKQSPDWD